MVTIITRVSQAVSMSLSNSKILALSLFASSSMDEELCDLVFSGFTRMEIGRALPTGRLHITDEEWDAFFSRQSIPVGTTDSVRQLAARPEFAAYVNRIESALSLTLQEPDAALAWSAPTVRLACFVALHTKESTHERIQSVLGTLLRSDARRLEDLRATLDDEGSDVLLLEECTRMLCQTVYP